VEPFTWLRRQAAVRNPGPVKSPSDGKTMEKSETVTSKYVYQAPIVFVGLFYALLVVWSAICVLLIGSKTIKAGWPVAQILMIAFVLVYTWYFSLGIVYKIELNENGDTRFKSCRREITVNARNIPLVEGPRLAILPYGFIRFRLEREKAYLFCLITDKDLQRILKAMRQINRGIELKGL
jgi:hypothetical protein